MGRRTGKGGVGKCKKPIETREQAEKKRRSLIAGGHPAWRIEVYHCKEHNCWHVGHVPGTRSKR